MKGNRMLSESMYLTSQEKMTRKQF